MSPQRLALMVTVAASLFGFAANTPGMGWVAVSTAFLALVGGVFSVATTRIPWSVLTLLAMVLCTVALGLGATPEGVLSTMLCYLMVHRIWTLSLEKDVHLVVLLSTLLLLVAASSGDSGVAWGMSWLVWMVSVPVALCPLDVRLNTARAAGVATLGVAGVLGLAGLVFVLTPRLSSDLSAAGDLDLTGFSETIELGDVDVLLENTDQVFRVQGLPVDSRRPLFRGAVLDAYDGRRWTSTEAYEETGQISMDAGPGHLLEFEVLSGTLGDVVFTAGTVHGVDAPILMTRSSSGVWRTTGPVSTWRVRASGPFDAGTGSEGAAPRADEYLGLPEGLEPAVTELSGAIAADALGVEDVIERTEAYLRENHAYTRNVRDQDVSQPIRRFLTEKRSGHCEYFAGAMVVLLRSQGVPSRLITGFAGGDLDEQTGEWLVRSHHAHAWVEAWVEGRGWVTRDPTPSVQPPRLSSVDRMQEHVDRLWRQVILEYDGGRQWRAAVRVGRTTEDAVGLSGSAFPWRGWFLSVCLLAGLLAGVEWLRLRWTRRRSDRWSSAAVDPVSSLYRRAVSHLEGGGLRAPHHLPPVSAARWWIREAGESVRPLEELAWLVYRVRYGDEPAERHLARAQSLVAVLLRSDVRRARTDV